MKNLEIQGLNCIVLNILILILVLILILNSKGFNLLIGYRCFWSERPEYLVEREAYMPKLASQ